MNEIQCDAWRDDGDGWNVSVMDLRTAKTGHGWGTTREEALAAALRDLADQLVSPD